jgi:CheY-like chemotaxis protein
MFDPNAQIALVPLLGASAGKFPLDELRRVLAFTPERRPVPPHDRVQVHDYRAELLARGARVLNKPIRDYVADRARVFIIDDDPATIETVRRYLGAAERKVDAKQPGVYVAPLFGDGEAERFGRFADLVSWCDAQVRERRTDGAALIFITDILFDRAWSFTRDARSSGIDLIRELRSLAERQSASIGIVAFTGLDSPVIAMAAYNHGADWVVTKGGDAVDHGHGHLELAGSGLHRLMLTVALLCFQKEFLRTKRETESTDPVDDAQQLLRVLPWHTVSPHLIEEWRDTNYILSARAMYGERAAPEEVKTIIDRMKAHHAS